LALATLCVAVGSPGLPADGRLRLDMLDVGQGDALLLRLPDGAALLIDGGGLTGSTFDLGRQVVVPAFWALGVRRLDLVIGTHPHHDHLGGLAAVVHHLPVDEAWLATGARDDADLQALRRACLERGTSLRRVVAGVTRRFGETELMVLHPPADVSRRDPNDASIVLVVAWGRERWLLAGDAGARVEAELGEQVGQAGLLKVGHHGSKTATTVEFLARLRPRLALISVGEGNRWRHPDDAVVARLAARGVRVLRTDRDGMVSVTSDGRVRTWQVTRSAAP
jgi:competence protein ComEC